MLRTSCTLVKPFFRVLSHAERENRWYEYLTKMIHKIFTDTSETLQKEGLEQICLLLSVEKTCKCEKGQQLVCLIYDFGSCN